MFDIDIKLYRRYDGPVRASDWALRQVSDTERKRYIAEGWWGGDSLGELFASKLEANADLPFVVHSQVRPWRGTFGDLLEMSRRVAAGLAARGVGPGDVVSFQTPNWIEGAATFYGAALLGAVVAPIVHIYGSRELAYILRQCEPRVHVTASRFGHQDFIANLASIETDPGLQVVVIDGDGPPGSSSFADLLDTAPIDAPLLTDPASPALVGWTSGTTANPKGVIHSHQTVAAEIKQMGATSPPFVRPNLVANPIGHAIGMQGALLLPVHLARPVHLLDVWNPAVVLGLMLEHDLGTNGGAPYFLTSLLDHLDFSEQHLERLRYQGMGGAPVPRPLAERATALGITVYRMYGSTEQPSIIGCTYGDPLEKRLSTDGRPLPGNEVRMVHPDGYDVHIGEQGEILSRGPDCFLGYTDHDLTAKVFDSDGWYHTGDVGVSDTAGYITITDRISDVIIRGGENISAAEIEAVLLAMPGIAELAVVSAPDSRMGEHAAAVFRMLPGRPLPEMSEVRSLLEKCGLARQKWPEEIVEVEDFPRTASGKIQKFALRSQLRER